MQWTGKRKLRKFYLARSTMNGYEGYSMKQICKLTVNCLVFFLHFNRVAELSVSALSITAHVGTLCEMTQTEFRLITNGICTTSGVVLRRNCPLKHAIERKVVRRIEVMKRRGRRRNQLLDDLRKS